VIPLKSARDHEEPGAMDAAAARAAMVHAIEVLERRYGDRWGDLPASLGRPAARAAELLCAGPTAVDGSAAVSDVVGRAAPLVDAAIPLVALVEEEADVLGEALGCDLVNLPLDRLAEVAGAVMDLGLVAGAEPTWANPISADAAQLVLVTLEEELRTTARLHGELYGDFTEHVLDLTDVQLRAGARRWRLIARARLRRRLAAASRTGRLPGELTSVARTVLAVLESRRRLAELAPLLSTHFGSAGWGPLTDVDAVGVSLAAVRRFQSVLGAALVPGRFAELLAAGAFASPELVQPATNLRISLDRWRLAVTTGCGGNPFALATPELASWATCARAVLPGITSGAAAMIAVDRPPTTLRSLVDDLLLRERVAELAALLQRRGVDGPASYAEPGSAS
jgi:hypothetical protein